jgi:hypothetical protein
MGRRPDVLARLEALQKHTVWFRLETVGIADLPPAVVWNDQPSESELQVAFCAGFLKAA